MARIKEYAHENQVDADLVGATIHRRIDLQFQGGGSDKVYICYAYERQHKTSAGNIITEHVAKGYYGRRGASLAENPLGSFKTMTEAANAAESQARKKEGGGGSSRYTRVNDEYGSTGQQTASQIGLMNAKQNPSQSKLDLSKTKVPKFTLVSPDDFETHLNSDDLMLEKVDEMKFVFLFLQQNGISVYNRETGDYQSMFTGSTPTFSSKGYTANHGVILEAYKSKTTGNYAITDIIQHPKIIDIEQKMWKIRRAMLTQVMSEIYPKADSYSSKLPIYLNDYWYDDKILAFERLTGIFVAKDIDDTYENSWLVTTKI